MQMLPWVEGKEDRLFKRLVITLVILFIILGIVLNSMTLPEVEKKKLDEVAPRLAKLILEKKKEPPPPPPKPKPKPKKKEVKKPEPEKKKEVKKPEVKKPKPKPLPKPDSREAARKKASSSGLMALQDDLADLRESFDVADISGLPQKKSGKQAKTVVNTSDLLTAKATQGSGGIKTQSLGIQRKTSEYTQRKTTAVKSTIESSQKIASKASTAKTRSASRSEEEIERVIQKNKGGIFNIYNRELRKDPSLQGKVVFEITIAANGSVTKCIISSSELGNNKLEKRLISKIKKIRFASKNVSPITVTYPIDFLPS